jgi:hypothetical protein
VFGRLKDHFLGGIRAIREKSVEVEIGEHFVEQ